MGLFCSPHSQDVLKVWKKPLGLQGRRRLVWDQVQDVIDVKVGALASNLNSETVRFTEGTDVLGARNYISDWCCHGAGRGRGSNQKANICATAKRVSVAACHPLCYLAVLLCGEVGLALQNFFLVTKITSR